jgi:methyltransferase
VSVALYTALLGLVGAERLFELGLSRRNIAWALGRGGHKVEGDAFSALAIMHAAFLPACLLEVVLLKRAFVPALGIPMLVVVAGAQALRYWAVATLGRRWSVRVVVIPDAASVTGGPYRFVRHPNYLAVVLEVAALPLVHGAYVTAAAFSALHAVLLGRRIRVEERALATAGDYRQRLGSKPRLWPKIPREARP